MHGLGYDRYGAVGNDWGSIISPQIARFDAGHVVGTHVTQIFLAPSNADELLDPSPEEIIAIKGLDWFKKNMSAYDAVQSQQPQTLAYAFCPIHRLDCWRGSARFIVREKELMTILC